MSGGNGNLLDETPHFAFDAPWLDDLILRLLPPTDAVKLKRNELEVIRAHVRHEVLHSAEVRKVLEDKIRAVFSGLRETTNSAS